MFQISQLWHDPLWHNILAFLLLQHHGNNINYFLCDVYLISNRSLVLNLSQVAGELEQVGDKQKPGIRVFGAINIFLENKMIVLEVNNWLNVFLITLHLIL